MLKTLSLTALIGSSLLMVPGFAQAERNGLVNIRQEEHAFRYDFSSDPAVLKDALEAYDCGVASGDSHHPFLLTIVDYSLPSYEKRLWVLNLETHRVLYHTYVAHGNRSGKVDATHFSNRPHSHESSIGLYETGSSYLGEWGYSMHLHGLERGYNSNAFRRSIVMHGGKYVSTASILEYGMIGMTHGCMAVPVTLDKSIIDTLRHGSLIFAYYPNSYWLATSHYLHCPILRKFKG